MKEKTSRIPKTVTAPQIQYHLSLTYILSPKSTESLDSAANLLEITETPETSRSQ
jgi:hypothetical protein